jgi:hypothetical protein
MLILQGPEDRPLAYLTDFTSFDPCSVKVGGDATVTGAIVGRSSFLLPPLGLSRCRRLGDPAVVHSTPDECALGPMSEQVTPTPTAIGRHLSPRRWWVQRP